MSLTIATDTDLAEVVALANLAYRGGDHAGWTREDYIGGDRTTVDELRADIAAKPEARLMLLRDGGTLLGTVWIEPAGEGAWYLGLLTVRPDLQAGGIGRRLLEGAEDAARALGGRTMRMTVVHIRDTLIAWYQRRGYALTGETLPFPYGDPPRDDLSFVVLEKALI
ncbi:GNAT family N-acetyltransferase [Sphingomonas crocodyli]|uniref:GNAT family N-acetyltransferase n=1 Tax=Sphingomonas crocodyli TaxID=1979270 RepID=A0A437MAA3_9SPHN|nr:GNAT family N-acetyltransferase [Sphingomonas crocodyli]RVT94575.1 GNAT family N-acetyltransferase [Sphingomonas crocodyli]